MMKNGRTDAGTPSSRKGVYEALPATVAILRTAGRPLRPTEFAQLANVPLGTAKARLWRYAVAGKLVALAGGRYAEQ